MPSPFPGMDPYLEDSAWWGTVHHALITYLWNTLNARLPPGFTATIGERLYVVHRERSIFPDVALLKRAGPGVVNPGSNGGAATLLADPPVLMTVEHSEIREGFIEIRRLRSPGDVVSMIEVLSPNNKTPGESGRELYLDKQASVLASECNLIEIDLLQGGQHTVAAPPAFVEADGSWIYLVSLHRAGEVGSYEAWPFRLQQRLPRISIPLSPDVPAVVMELQPLLDRCYNEGRFAESIDYSTNPSVRLSLADAAWVDALLREKGLRH